MVCTAGPSGVRRPPWEVLPSRRPIVQRPSADCEDDPEPGTRTSTSRKKGLAQGAAIRRPRQAPLLNRFVQDQSRATAIAYGSIAVLIAPGLFTAFLFRISISKNQPQGV